MKPANVKSSTYIDFSKENYNKDPKFKIGEIVRISKYKNSFAKGYTPGWSTELFVIKIVEITVLRTYVISDLDGAEIIGTFYQKNILQKKNHKEFRIEKVIKENDDKLYVKWKEYNNLFNSSVDKKYII